MGIIQIANPKDSVLQEPMPRVTEFLSAKDFATKAPVPIRVYQNTSVIGYSKMNVRDFEYENGTKVSFLKKVDVIWFEEKCKNFP